MDFRRAARTPPSHAHGAMTTMATIGDQAEPEGEAMTEMAAMAAMSTAR